VKRAALAFAFALAVAMFGARADAAVIASDAWSRPAIDTGVVYVHVANTGSAADTLIGARSAIARAVELHRSMEMSGTMNGMAMDDVSAMKPVRALPIAAHGTLALAPGGAHIMLIGLRHDLHAGEHFALRLHFVHAGWLPVNVRVRPI
jgi:copper(I)-binding protein